MHVIKANETVTCFGTMLQTLKCQISSAYVHLQKCWCLCYFYLTSIPMPSLKILLEVVFPMLKPILTYVLTLHHISSLAAPVQYTTHCNQLLKNQTKNPTIIHQSGILCCHPDSQQEEEILFKSSYSSEEGKGRTPCYRTSSASSQTCSFGFWKYLARNPVVSALCLSFTVWNSRFHEIPWTKEKAEEVFQYLFVFFREEIITYVRKRAKQFY